MGLKIERWYKVFSDGSHNAFTDVCWFRGSPYCTFRHATNHLSEDGRVLVLRGSPDGSRWQVMASIRGPADTRDPKLMPTPDGLLCYSFVALHDPGGSRFSAGCSLSRDGETWGPWRLIEEDLIYWRPRWHDGRGYVAAYGVQDCTVVFKSTVDGLTWDDVSALAQREGQECPNETAFDFGSDGVCWALVRRECGEGHPLLARSDPPYTRWTRVELAIKLQGPCLWLVGEQVYISGRWYQPGGHVNTAIFRLDGIQPVCQVVLPSGGDTSYMGAARHPQDDRRYWLTYYSSHEYSPRVNSHEHPADVFICDVLFDDEY